MIMFNYECCIAVFQSRQYSNTVFSCYVKINAQMWGGSVVRALAAKARGPGFDSQRLPRFFSLLASLMM